MRSKAWVELGQAPVEIKFGTNSTWNSLEQKTHHQIRLKHKFKKILNSLKIIPIVMFGGISQGFPKCFQWDAREGTLNIDDIYLEPLKMPAILADTRCC